MERTYRRLRRFLLVLLLFGWLAVRLTVPGLAQTGGGYDLMWNSIDSGGGVSSNSSYTLSGTIGQPDAHLSTGGDYRLTGGFLWATGDQALNLPIIRR